MRIISGIYKKKKLILPRDKSTRPIKDLVKESIFNIILHSNLVNFDIRKSHILDLFSGTGSFGLECISRGAEKVIFFENHKMALKVLKENLKNIGLTDKYQIFEKDCYSFFETQKTFKYKFELIFIDPPFKDEGVNKIINNILNQKLLSLDGFIIIHRHKDDNIKISKSLNIFKECVYGKSKIFFGS